MNVALMAPDRVSRVVTLDTVLDPREAWMSETWVQFRDFVVRIEDLPAGAMMRGTCIRALPDEVAAAYDAPYPTLESKAALKGLPLSVPRVQSDVEAAPYEEIYDALRRDRRPILIVWAHDDLILTLASGERLASRIGRQIDHVIPDAGHGLQEDQGPMVGSLIADWLISNP
jgi:haloalkane dehalogenase